MSRRAVDSASARCAFQQRNNPPVPEVEKRSVEIEHLGGSAFRPIQFGRSEGRWRRRVEKVVGVEARQARKLLATALSDLLVQLLVEIAEKRERLCSAPFLAHKQHRNLGRQQID